VKFFVFTVTNVSWMKKKVKPVFLSHSKNFLPLSQKSFWYQPRN